MWQDFGYAARTLRKTPGFTAIAALSPALGIGATFAVFSLADGMLLRPPPVPNALRLIVVQSRLRGESIGGPINYSGVSYLAGRAHAGKAGGRLNLPRRCAAWCARSIPASL